MPLVNYLVPDYIKGRLILPYLGNKRNSGTPKQFSIARNAANSIFQAEDPPGSNRGPEVDEYNNNFYSPPGSSWCANAVGTWVRNAGGKIPKSEVGDCDRWMELAINENIFSLTPKIGSVVLYGKSKTDITHVAVVIMLYPYLLDVGGNTTLAGYSRNGDIVAGKPVRTDLVIGYAEVWR